MSVQQDTLGTGASRVTDEPHVPLHGAARLGLYLAVLACFTTPWNGIAVGSLRPGDLLTFAAVAVLVIAEPTRRFPRLPWWATSFVAVVVLVTAAHEVLPTDEQYLRSRVVVDAAGNLIQEIYSNSFTGAKLAVGVLALIFMLTAAASYDTRAILRCAVAFAAGAAVSGVAAFAETLGLLHLGISSEGSRSGGLAIQANFLGETCAMSIPVALYLIVRPDKQARTLGTVLAVCLAIGAYASASRGGSVTLLATGILAAVLIPGYRRFLPTIALALGVVVTVLFVSSPGTGAKLLSSLRLDNSTNAQGSNVVRDLVAQQGSRDFQHSPIYGVGMQVAAEAHNVYVQALASGGLILLAAFVVFQVMCVVTGFGLLRRVPLAAPVTASVVAVVALNFVENSFADRLAYFPGALTAALLAVSRRRADSDARREPSMPR